MKAIAVLCVVVGVSSGFAYAGNEDPDGNFAECTQTSCRIYVQVVDSGPNCALAVWPRELRVWGGTVELVWVIDQTGSAKQWAFRTKAVGKPGGHGDFDEGEPSSQGKLYKMRDRNTADSKDQRLGYSIQVHAVAPDNGQCRIDPTIVNKGTRLHVPPKPSNPKR